MEDVKATQRTFDGLAHLGVFLSIDDFGTGYSNLGYLGQLPAQQFKIDRSFVNDLEASEGAPAPALVSALLSLAHALLAGPQGNKLERGVDHSPSIFGH